MAKRGRAPLVDVTDRYQLYSQWLGEQDESYSEIPPDHLQIAVKLYHRFQASDLNRNANAERIKANAAKRGDGADGSKRAKATKAAKAAKATAAEDDEDGEEAAAPPPVKRPPAKKNAAKGRTRAAF